MSDTKAWFPKVPAVLIAFVGATVVLATLRLVTLGVALPALMPSRLAELQASLDGLMRTGVPLVAQANGILRPVDSGDGPGLYLFVPLLARMTGLGVLNAATVFLYGLVALALEIGAAGCAFVWKDAPRRVVSVGALAVAAWFTFEFGQTYTIPVVIVIGAAPWLVAVVIQPVSRLRWQCLIYGCVGLAAGLANMTRSHSGTVILVMATGLLILNGKVTGRRRLATFAVLMAGAVVALASFSVVFGVRDDYLARTVPGYVKRAQTNHTWHSIYIGLGYVKNPYGIRYLDEVAINRVHELAPQATYLSPEYEGALRTEVFRLARKDPAFIISNVLHKTWRLLILFVALTNVGLVAAIRHRKPWFIDVSFLLALLLAAAPGVFVLPLRSYVSGFIALSLIWAAVSFNYSPWPDWVAAWARGEKPDFAGTTSRAS